MIEELTSFEIKKIFGDDLKPSTYKILYDLILELQKQFKQMGIDNDTFKAQLRATITDKIKAELENLIATKQLQTIISNSLNDKFREVIEARKGFKTLGERLNSFNSKMDNISEELKKPITLNNCGDDLIGAIQNKEGETTFNLLSIPRDNSVTAGKLNINYIESHSNLLHQPKLESFTFSGGNNAESSPLSDIVTLQNGNYFGFAEINVTDLKNYTQGFIGLRFIHSGVGDCLDFYAGDNKQLFTNGKLYLYGNFNINSECQVKAILRFWNAPNNISFNFSVNKLYLFKTTSTEKLIDTLKKYNYNKEIAISNYINGTSNIDDNCITYNKLDENLKNAIDTLSLSENNIIDCWGDSLMYGTGGNGVTMPNELQKLLPNYTINNYGQGGEKAEEIAFRQGGMFAYAEPFTLKANGSYTDIKVSSVDGLEFSNLNLQGTYYGNNFVYINGIKCFFRKSENDGFYKVAIAQEIPKDIIFSKKQILIAESFYKKNNNILIICVGENGWIDNNYKHLCDIVEKMIKKNNAKKFLIISRPSGNKETMNEEEKEYACRFGNNYFNARDYISKYGLLDNNLSATANDLQAINVGAIPPQLLVDNVHGNEYFYKSYAIGVYEHLKHIL